MILIFGWRDLRHQWRLTLTLSLVIAVSVTGYLTLVGYHRGTTRQFDQAAPDYLIVQESHTVGEHFGSRISSQVGDDLVALGVSLVVPEIHTVVGTSIKDATLLRGVDLDAYLQVDHLDIHAGQALGPGDARRSAMLGSRLANKLGMGVGDNVLLRGRQFEIMGIFQLGTYADNEVWVPIEGAQDLLGWDEEVSTFVIPDEGVLHPGDQLPGGLSVDRRGEAIRISSTRSIPVFDFFGVIIQVFGIATAFALTNVLLRLAWIRRREMAILRCVGFGDIALVGSLFVQAATVTFFGVSLGVLGIFLLASTVQSDILGISIQPEYDSLSVLISLVWVVLIILGGTLLPAWWLSRLNLAQLLRSD